MHTAIILSAGRGERLKPLTYLQPKGMCIVKGRALIEHHLIKLVAADFRRVIINHAYLGDQIRRYFGKGSSWNIEICYSPEPPGGLETGGGLLNALPLIGVESFLAVNADIYTDFDFSLPTCLPNFLAQIILVKNPSHNLAGDYGLNGYRVTNKKSHTFAGIACYRPELFHNYNDFKGRYSVTPLIRKLVEQQKVSGLLYPGKWFDIGTPERLSSLQNL